MTFSNYCSGNQQVGCWVYWHTYICTYVRIANPAAATLLTRSRMPRICMRARQLSIRTVPRKTEEPRNANKNKKKNGRTHCSRPLRHLAWPQKLCTASTDDCRQWNCACDCDAIALAALFIIVVLFLVSVALLALVIAALLRSVN